MWQAGGLGGFINGILRQHLNRSILGVHEKLAKTAMVSNAAVKSYAGGATDFSGLAKTSDYKFDIKQLRDIKLRLSIRSQFSLQQFGDYASPVPGSNNLLIITTPGVMFDLWDQMDGEWMQDLRDLQDQRIINGGVVSYQGFTFVETWDAALWAMGPVSKQVGITSAVTAGDGAPDPDSTKVDGVWMIGQSSSAIKHYVQCSDIGTSQFAAGDFVVLHKARTSAWGVSNGCDYLDGDSMLLEVYSKDESGERLTFRSPIMQDFGEAFTDASLGTVFGYVTKAQHVHPIFFVGARGGNLFAMRRPVQIHTPPAIDDFESVVRVSWDEYGAMNKWNPDLWETHFAAASFGNRGEVQIA